MPINKISTTLSSKKGFTTKQIEQSLKHDIAPDGKPAKVVTLKNNNGMSITIMDLGATWVSCQLQVDGSTREVLLGMMKLDEYINHSAYLGATIGRFANRINKGKFMLNNKVYQTSINNDGNTLHGGKEGFNTRRWTIAERSDNHTVFRLTSPDGDQGFPGNISIEVAYTLTECNQVCIEYSALCDQDCPINLTNHAYFNLDGSESGHLILNHKLQLQSEFYATTDKSLIPTGILNPVKNTSFDFTRLKTIGSQLLQGKDQQLANGYDHAFTFSPELCDGATPVATLISGDNKVTMTVLTEKPAIQLYTGNYLAQTPSRVNIYKNYQGVALETQFLPDAPNQSAWPKENKPFIAKKSFYQYQTSYQFYF